MPNDYTSRAPLHYCCQNRKYFFFLPRLKSLLSLNSIEIEAMCGTLKPTEMKRYHETKQFTSVHYFNKCFMHKIGVSNRRWHDSWSMYYIETESSIRNSSYIVHKTCVKITEWDGLFGLNLHATKFFETLGCENRHISTKKNYWKVKNSIPARLQNTPTTPLVTFISIWKYIYY